MDHDETLGSPRAQQRIDREGPISNTVTVAINIWLSIIDNTVMFQVKTTTTEALTNQLDQHSGGTQRRNGSKRCSSNSSRQPRPSRYNSEPSIYYEQGPQG